VAWPLAGCSFLINNWVELRSDALKIAAGSRRPIPWRADSIGPWLNALGFLSWLGSLTSSAIVFLCRGDSDGTKGAASNIQTWGFLLTILLAEHFYLVVQIAVRFLMDKIDSPGLQRERKERFNMKKRLLVENLGEKAAFRSAAPGIELSEKLTRTALREESEHADHASAENMCVSIIPFPSPSFHYAMHNNSMTPAPLPPPRSLWLISACLRLAMVRNVSGVVGWDRSNPGQTEMEEEEADLSPPVL